LGARSLGAAAIGAAAPGVASRAAFGCSCGGGGGGGLGGGRGLGSHLRHSGVVGCGVLVDEVDDGGALLQKGSEPGGPVQRARRPLKGALLLFGELEGVRRRRLLRRRRPLVPIASGIRPEACGSRGTGAQG
jgi:hypothetical protein